MSLGARSLTLGAIGCVGLLILVPHMLPVPESAALAGVPSALGSVPAPINSGTTNISVHESGLPNGTTWWVAVADTNHSGLAGQTFNFTIPSGTYNVTAGAEGNWSCGGLQILATPGFNVEIQVGCWSTLPQPPKYSVVFEELGLPSTGFINWTVTLGGWIQPPSFFGSDLKVSFEETNGSYGYKVAAPGYNATPSSGTVRVVGMNLTIAITFTLNNSSSGCNTNCTGWGGPPLGGSPIAPGGTSGAALAIAAAWVVLGILLGSLLIAGGLAGLRWRLDRRTPSRPPSQAAP